MTCAAGVEFAVAGRAIVAAVEIFVYRQPAAAGAAEDGVGFKLVSGPLLCVVTFSFVVTLAAWKPSIAAFKFDRDDVERRVVMRAAGFLIDRCTINSLAVNDAHQRTFAVMVISLLFGG